MATPAVRFRLDFGPHAAVGPGKIALLERIHATGSLAAAARALRMSYRRAWLLLDSLNYCFDGPVVLTRTGGARGGGSRLTPLGVQLLQGYRRFEARLQRSARRSFAALGARVSARARSPAARVP